MTLRTWKARFFRLWLAIALPMSCWTAYQAFDANKKAQYYQQEADFWLERAKSKGQEHNIHDPDKSTSTIKLLEKQRNEIEAESFAWLTTILIALPFIGLISLKIFGWMWSGVYTSTRKNDVSKR